MFRLCVVLIAAAVVVSGQQAGYRRHRPGPYNPGHYNPGLYNPDPYNPYRPRPYEHPVVPAIRNPEVRLNNLALDESPKPYSFNYAAPADDGVGHSSRQETADGSGRVEGTYSLTNDEGHTRVVQYVADEGGFRATIQTNEPGTDNQNPADVVIESLSPGARPPVTYRGDRPVPVPVEIPVEADKNIIEQPLVQPARPLYPPQPYYRGRYNPGRYIPGGHHPHYGYN